MESLRDVLLHLVRHTPASPPDLAAMERIVAESYPGDPATGPGPAAELAPPPPAAELAPPPPPPP